MSEAWVQPQSSREQLQSIHTLTLLTMGFHRAEGVNTGSGGLALAAHLGGQSTFALQRWDPTPTPSWAESLLCAMSMGGGL